MQLGGTIPSHQGNQTWGIHACTLKWEGIRHIMKHSEPYEGLLINKPFNSILFTILLQLKLM